MVRVVFAAVLLSAIPAGALAVFLWHLAKRRYETRMLRKDPKILAQQGRLEQKAAERLVDMALDVQTAAKELEWAASTLDAVLKHETAVFLQKDLADEIATQRDALIQRARLMQKSIK